MAKGNASFSKGYNGKNPPEGTSEEIDFSTGNTFKDLTMHQLHQCIRFSNVEYRGGFYSSVTTKDGSEKEIYVQDTREVFSNAVFALALLLQPRFDRKMRESFETITGEVEKLTTTFIKKSDADEEVVLGDSFYTTDKDKILLETYKNKKLIQYQKLLARISDLLSRMNYLDLGGGSF